MMEKLGIQKAVDRRENKNVKCQNPNDKGQNLNIEL